MAFYILPDNKSIPIKIKAPPEINCIQYIGIYLCNKEPAKTPKREDKISATADPIKTCHIDSDFEASIIVDSCVLSPNSAKKTKINVVNIDFNTLLPL